eukprot:605238-Hanusia_phi.AAC.1
MIPYPHSRPSETLSRLQAWILCTGQYDLRSLSKEGVRSVAAGSLRAADIFSVCRRPGTGGRGPFTTKVEVHGVLRPTCPGDDERRCPTTPADNTRPPLFESEHAAAGRILACRGAEPPH